MDKVIIIKSIITFLLGVFIIYQSKKKVSFSNCINKKIGSIYLVSGLIFIIANFVIKEMPAKLLLDSLCDAVFLILMLYMFIVVYKEGKNSEDNENIIKFMNFKFNKKTIAFMTVLFIISFIFTQVSEIFLKNYIKMRF